MVVVYHHIGTIYGTSKNKKRPERRFFVYFMKFLLFRRVEDNPKHTRAAMRADNGPNGIYDDIQIANLRFDIRDKFFRFFFRVRLHDKHFIFSHAGINKEYARYCFEDEVNEENVVRLFNEKYFEDNYGIMDTLGMYSRIRGKWGGKYGSLVWADILEWITDESNEAYGYSIVGHTRVSKPIINDKFAFIDNQQAFVINSNGEINTYKDFKNVDE